MKRNTKIFLGLFVIAMIWGASMTVLYFTRGGEEEKPTTLTYETIGEPNYLDPALNYETTGDGIMQQIVEPLVWFYKSKPWYYEGSERQIVPWLAKSWDISEDGKTYTFTLREGIEFSNGDEVNATAAVYSLYRWPISYPTYSGPQWMALENVRGGLSYMSVCDNEDSNHTDLVNAAENLMDAEPFEIVSENKLKIHLRRSFKPFLKILTNSWASVLNPWFLQEKTDDFLQFQNGEIAVNGDMIGKHVEKLETGKALCGSGGYKFQEWAKEQHVILTKNSDYWGGPYDDQPTIDKFILELVPEYSTRRTDLLAGDADVADIPSTHAFSFIKEDPWTENRTIVVQDDYEDELEISTGLAPTNAAGHFNVNETLTYDGNRYMNPFRLKKMRKAASYAFPFEDWMDTAVNGFGLRSKGAAIPKGIFGYAGDDPEVNDSVIWQNKSKAEQLLQEVANEYGFTDGNNTIHTYYNEGNTVREYVCTMLKNSLETVATNVGVDLTVEINAQAWSSYVVSLTNLNAQFFVIGWAPDYPDGDNYAYAYGHPSGTFAYWANINDTKLKNWIEAEETTVNSTKRQQIFKNITLRMNNEALKLWLHQDMIFHVQRERVNGWYFNPMHSLYGAPWLPAMTIT